MNEEVDTLKKEMPYGFAASYEVTLYFEHEPVISNNVLVERISERLGKTTFVKEGSDTVILSLEEFPLSDGWDGNAQIVVTSMDTGPSQSKFNRYLAQTWHWPEAADLSGNIHYQVTLSCRIGLGLPYKERLVLFQLALYSLVAYTRPIGIQWHASEQLIDPLEYLDNVPGEDDYDLLYGPLNVRMFSIKDTSDDTVMDTIGLAALGIVDIQCCFYGYDKEAMADLLYHYGNHVFWYGDVLNEGERIEGIETGDKWEVRHELSQLEPRRPVLNIGPEIM